MDQGSLVERQINDGLWIINELSRDGFDVTAAFWLKESENGQWFFYIASQDVDRKGLATAYRTVLDTLKRKPDLWIDRFQVKLIGATNPITQDVLAIRGPQSGIPTRYFGSRLGNVSIEEAFIYGPLPAPQGVGA